MPPVTYANAAAALEQLWSVRHASIASAVFSPRTYSEYVSSPARRPWRGGSRAARSAASARTGSSARACARGVFLNAAARRPRRTTAPRPREAALARGRAEAAHGRPLLRTKRGASPPRLGSGEAACTGTREAVRCVRRAPRVTAAIRPTASAKRASARLAR